MIIESGMIVALGLLFTFLKLSWRQRIKMISHPLAMDLGIFILLTFLHWGSFYGIMAATCGAMITSAMISIGRKLFGYMIGTVYYPGMFNIVEKIR
jgi:hypothetical protein